MQIKLTRPANSWQKRDTKCEQRKLHKGPSAKKREKTDKVNGKITRRWGTRERGRGEG